MKTSREVAQLLREADDFLTDGRDIPEYVDDPVHSWALKARAVYRPVLWPKVTVIVRRRPKGRRGRRRSR